MITRDIIKPLIYFRGVNFDLRVHVWEVLPPPQNSSTLPHDSGIPSVTVLWVVCPPKSSP